LRYGMVRCMYLVVGGEVVVPFRGKFE
jgi:hypothetical protein